MKGRYQLPTHAKFNRPDPQRDWDWLRPNTINLYQYCANDPINAWDPTGSYSVQPPALTGNEEKDAKILQTHETRVKAFENARQTLDARGGEFAAAVERYGTLNDGNGIVVEFVAPGNNANGTAGNASIGNVTDDEGNISWFMESAEVQIDPRVFNSQGDVEAVVGHEGVHLNQYAAFIESINEDRIEGNPALNLTIEDAEIEAYQMTHMIIRKGNYAPQNFPAGRGSVQLGTGVSPTKAKKNISKIVKHLYKNDLKNRLFKNFPPYPPK